MTEFFLSIFFNLAIISIGYLIYLFVKSRRQKTRNRIRRIFRKISLARREIKEREAELTNEEQSTINEIVEAVKNADAQIADKIKEVQRMNTVTFECPCKHNMVAAFIDLSKEENTFICPECHNEYSVKISMVPVLKGKIVDDTNMYKLLQDARDKQN